MMSSKQKPNIQCPNCAGMLFVPINLTTFDSNRGMICNLCNTYFTQKEIRERCGC